MPRDNRTLIAIGAGLAVLAAVVLALLFSGGRSGPAAPPPAAQGGLTVDLADAPTLEATRELRCFVNGQFIGMATLADCARRNGLATDALDVGIDETGALAAAPTASLTPPPALPPVELTEVAPEPQPVQPEASQPAPVQTAGPAGSCLRYAGNEWQPVAAGSLNACVQTLYAGICVRPGEALYGRWGDMTLRLVPRRVEQSGDNRRFRTLVEQNSACQFPGLR